ncbi:MAG: hypothetical protein AAF998_27010 [Bacteroidota bacterium]
MKIFPFACLLIPVRKCHCRLLFGLIGLIHVQLAGFGQSVRSPSEIAEITQQSQLDYSIEVVPERLPEPPLTQRNHSRLYQEVSGEGYQIAEYGLDSVDQAVYAAAERAYRAQDYGAARRAYLALLARNPEYGFVMTLVGECYKLTGESDSATVWYERAIAANFFDYLPHWFLASSLLERGESEAAAREIATAWTLNRNHNQLRAVAQQIFTQAGRKVEDFQFRSEAEVRRKGAQVVVEAREDWIAYGLCKAIWAFEPGIRPANADENYCLPEEEECLLNLFAVWEADKDRKGMKSPLPRTLKRAIEERWLAEFVFFELWLPREPLIVYTQPREGIEAIARYVVEVRGQKK